MPRWQCPKGHQWEQSADENVDACPQCGSRVFADCSVNDDNAGMDETLVRPAAVHVAKQPSISNPSAANLPAPSAGSMDVTLDRPAQPQPTGNKRPPTPDRASLPTDHQSNETLDIDAPATQNPDGNPTAPINAGNDGTLMTDVSSKTFEGAATAPLRQKIGDYEILGELGRGGMGVVYKARHIKLNRLTALKMILSGSHASSEHMLRFQTEAKAVAKLQHPNIVQLFEVDEHEGRPYFALEYVEGGSLQKKLDGKPMASRDAAKMTKALADAMENAHKNGLIHRDLKPANVLLTSDGTPKITDFGLAKSFKEDSSQTGTGAILGTPSYMSPEQAEGKVRDIGPPTDIYSLGALLYDMITGRAPFVGETVVDTLQQVRHEEPLPPRRLRPNVPRDLEVICLRCLRKEPHRRYESAQALADDLARFLSGEPILARPTGVWERTCKWARRYPLVASLLGLLVAVIAGALAATTALWLQAESAFRNVDSANQKLRMQTIAAVKARNDADAEKHKAMKAQSKAVQEQLKAEENFKRARRMAYVTQMNLVHQAIREGYPDAGLQILINLENQFRKQEETGQENLLGFEWHFAKRLCTKDLSLRLKAHANHITQTAFSADGSLLLTVGLDRTVKLWDVYAKREKFVLQRQANPVRAIAISPDNRRLALASSSGAVTVWDIRSEKKIHQCNGHDLPVQGLAFSPDGKLLASAGDDKTVRIWKMQSMEKTHVVLKGHAYAVTCLAFGPNGRYLATGSQDRTIRLWNLATGKTESTFRGHSDCINCLTFSADGKQLASGSQDQTVRLWNLAGRIPPKALSDHKAPVRSISFSPDGGRLASSDSTGTVKIWDIVNFLAPKSLPGNPNLVRTVSFSPDGQLLASIGFVLKSQELTESFEEHESAVRDLVITPDGKAVTCATVLEKGSGVFLSQADILVWNANDRKVTSRFRLPNGHVYALAVDPAGTLLAAGCEDGGVKIIDLTKEKEMPGFPAHQERMLSVAFHPKKKILAGAGDKGRIYLWDLQSKKEWSRFDGHTLAVRQIAFSPNGDCLASASDDGSVILWDLKTGQKKRALTGHGSRVTTVAFSPDGAYLATGGADQTVRIWHVETGQTEHVLDRHMEEIARVAFSPDGKRLVSCSLDHKIKMWDVIAGEETLTLKGHRDGVTCVAFTPDGMRLLSGSLDRTVRIWQARE